MDDVIGKAGVETLALSRTIKADVKRVFEAWTRPELLQKWLGPEGVIVKKATVDLVVGGRYDQEMITPGGDHVHHYGFYREIDPNRRLVFTWILDGQACSGSDDTFVETKVIVELKEKGEEVEVALTHTVLLTQEICYGHRFGWEGCLVSVDALLQGIKG